MHKATVITLGGTPSNSIRVMRNDDDHDLMLFDDVADEYYSEARGKWRAKRQAKKMEKIAAKKERKLAKTSAKDEIKRARVETRQARRSDKKEGRQQLRIGRRAARKDARQDMRGSQLQRRQDRRMSRKTAKQDRKDVKTSREQERENYALEQEALRAQMLPEESYAEPQYAEDEYGYEEDYGYDQQALPSGGGAYEPQYAEDEYGYEEDYGYDQQALPSGGGAYEPQYAEDEYGYEDEYASQEPYLTDYSDGYDDVLYQNEEYDYDDYPEFYDDYPAYFDGTVEDATGELTDSKPTMKVSKKVQDAANKISWNEELVCRLKKTKAPDSDQKILERETRVAELKKELDDYVNFNDEYENAIGRASNKPELKDSPRNRRARGLEVSAARHKANAARKAQNDEKRVAMKKSKQSLMKRGGDFDTKVTPVEASLNPEITTDRIVVPSEKTNAFNGTGTGIIGLDQNSDYGRRRATEVKLGIDGRESNKNNKLVTNIVIGGLVAAAAIYVIRKYKLLK